MYSLSEIETISKRASKAAGYSWGMAEEIGKATSSLELFGLQGVKNLNLYLNIIKERHPKKISKIERDNRHEELCPIYCGVAFLDQVLEVEPLRKITFYNLSYPILILAFISKASEVLGKKILVKFSNLSFLMNFNKSILAKDLDSQVIVPASDISIEILDNEDSFSNDEWQELSILSEKTFVEESGSLKEKGAGAGLLDND